MIGAGNVALDVARMLVLTHVELAVTDIADRAGGTRLQRRGHPVLVLARRGHDGPRSPTPSCSSCASCTMAM